MRSIYLSITITTLFSLATINPNASAQSVACGAEKVLGSIEPDWSDSLSMLDSNTLIAMGVLRLDLFNISDPSNIIQQSSLSFSDYARGMAHHDGFIYYSFSQPNELSVISVQDPANPQLVSTIPTVSSHAHMAFADDYAYFSDNQSYNNDGSFLYIYDISSPAIPVLVNSIDMGTPIVDLQATPGHLYIRSSDIFTYDLSDPINPVLDSTLLSSDYFSGMRVVNDLVYLTENADRILVADFADPANPITLGSLELVGSPSSISVQGTHAFVLDGDNSFSTIDISDPTNLSRLGSTVEQYSIRDIAPNNDQLVLAESGKLSILDTALTIGPDPIQSLTPTGGRAREVAIVGNRCFLAAGDAGLQVYDITAPYTPILISSQPTSGTAVGIKIQGNYAFVAYYDGFDVFDISDPDNPALVTTVTETIASRIAVDGDLLATGITEPGSIALYDITNPANPTLLSIHSGPEYPGELIIRGNTIFCAGGYTSLVTIDISDPTNPTTADIFDAPGYAEFSTEIGLAGDIAIINSDDSQLYSIDVSDPYNIDLISSKRITAEPNNIDISNGQLVTSVYDGIHLYDASDPTDITWIASSRSPSRFFRPTISGDTVFAGSSASYAEGLWAINIGACSPCQADLDHDGLLTFFDVSIFLNAFTAQDPIADFEPDGSFNFFDVSAYLAAFSGGCP
ncbi:MAG: GC-type dockerin domain-anchored protein [Phycisphaerales bacterium]